MIDAAELRNDPVAFIENVLVNPETGEPFELYPEQVAFLRAGLTPLEDGSLPFGELVFSAPKKSGKTALGAMVELYVVVGLGGRYAEGYVLANDLEQSTGRVFKAAARIVEASPLLSAGTRITNDTIEFSTGATITALASDYAGAAGANPNISVFDELWGYTSENSHRLWDEMVPPPTRKVATRLTVTYAGFEGESKLLENLLKAKGEQIAPGLYRTEHQLTYLTHDVHAPWQTDEWLGKMRSQLRPSAYLRMIENRFVTSESSFVEMEWWDGCVNADTSPVLSDPKLPVYVGVDASTKRDSTAVVVCAYDTDAKKVRLIWHRIFQPSKAEPLDFEASVERTVLDLRARFNVREVRFDPYQMQASAQRLTREGVRMVEFPQTVGNLTAASTNLYEAIKGRNLLAYPDEDVRLGICRSVAIEGARGWKIAKEKASHKIDVVVAMAMAALGAVEGSSRRVDVDVSGMGLAMANADLESMPAWAVGDQGMDWDTSLTDWPS